MKRYLIGIDVGTTSVKTVICDAIEYKIIFTSKAEHNLYSPFPGWAEENPKDWWNNTIKTIKQCINGSRIDPKEIAGIGASGMVPAFVLVDRYGEILRPSMQQNDARTSKEMEFIRSKINDNEFFKITGCMVNQQMVGPKILWMKNNESDIFSKVHKIMGSYDYIVYKLTGKYSLEHNWALESGLYDIHFEKWSERILEIVGVNSDLFPKIGKPDNIIDTILPDIANETGIPEGTPVVAGAADHVASAFMAGIQDEGDLLLKFGGAGDILYSTDKLITDKRLFIDYHLMPTKFLLNGCMASSGSALKWFLRQILDENKMTFKEMDKKAEEIKSGSEGIIILPYFIGEKTPIFDALARGVIFGLSLHHTKFHIYKALLEAIGYGFNHHIEVLKDIDFKVKKVIVTNGGSISKTWGKITSNIIGYPIHYLKDNPGSSLGAAFVAGIGTGCFSDWEEAKNFIKFSGCVYPDKEENIKYGKYFKIYKEIYKNLKDNFKQLNKLVES